MLKYISTKKCQVVHSKWKDAYHVEGVVRFCDAVQVSQSYGGHFPEVHVGGVVIGESQALQVALGGGRLPLHTGRKDRGSQYVTYMPPVMATCTVLVKDTLGSH